LANTASELLDLFGETHLFQIRTVSHREQQSGNVSCDLRASLSSHERIVLLKLIAQKNDSRYHAKISYKTNGLTELELLQFFSPRYAPACILTVNRRLLPANSRHSHEQLNGTDSTTLD
jgi:hypothetical protein